MRQKRDTKKALPNTRQKKKTKTHKSVLNKKQNACNKKRLKTG